MSRLSPAHPIAIYLLMKSPSFVLEQCRGMAVALDDRARLPWRFLARHMAIAGLRRSD